MVKLRPMNSISTCTAIGVENKDTDRTKGYIMKRVQIEILLGTLLVFVTGGIIIFVGLNEESRMAKYAEAQHAAAIEVGAALYEINCSGCHGVKGEGTLNLCPPLNDRHFFTDRLAEVGWSGTLEDYVFATVSSGRLASTRPDQYPGQGKPAMPSWAESAGGPLREDQIRAIATFILNWRETAMGQVQLQVLPTPTPRPEELTDPVARGRLVYQSSGCSGCHTLDGLSVGTVGPNQTKVGETAAARLPSMSAEEYIRQSILDPSAHLVEGYQDLMPKAYSQTLNPEQLNDLVAFLLAQK